MNYGVQHNGNGKIHLTDENNECICGTSSGNMLWTDDYEITIVNGEFIEQNRLGSKEVEEPHMHGYCKKCVNKVLSKK